MSVSVRLDRAIAEVVANQNCSGCGGCTLLDPNLVMARDQAGFNRPVRATPSAELGTDTALRGAVATFDQICPGRRVTSPRPPGASVHPTLGPVLSTWEAWAGDPEVRHRGSSGGALTALAGWLIETGQVSRLAGAQSDPDQPQTTVSVFITTRAEALAASGSRYGPVSTLAEPGALASGRGLVGKPCEVSAARALLNLRSSAPTSTRSGSGAGHGSDTEAGSDAEPVLLSFFCAGTPSQHATDSLIADLGLPKDTALDQMWYRGRGWPGRFTAKSTDGRTVSASYDESWGASLGPAVQWRCKICPDGVGESADISAADFWQTDERGYPDFTEGDGSSAVLARTPRGEQILIQAFAEGVLIGRRIDPDAVAAVQPLQVSRRSTLFGRLLGTRMAGRKIPRYRGFGLARLGLGDPRISVRTGRGSFRRVRAGRTNVQQSVDR